MKGRSESKSMSGVQSTDLLVCFPTRAHLTLMPKPICSPARSSDPPKRRHNSNHHLKRITTTTTPRSAIGPGQASSSPLAWPKNNKQPSPESSEPTSPKVTCAGQIKVKHRATAPAATCRNWQSVMEEVERIHNRSKNKKKSSWVGPLGFKKEVLNFLTCLRSIKFDLRCFGSFPDPEITSDEEEDEDEDENDQVFKDVGDQGSSDVFSKWFMVLQDNKEIINTNYTNNNDDKGNEETLENYENAPPEVVPPPNALLLMRCRSAPAKNRVQQRGGGEETEESQMRESEKVKEKEDEEMKKKRKKKRRASLAIVMKYDTEFYKMDDDDYYVDQDVAQETWIVGELKKDHLLSRSRSWKK